MENNFKMELEALRNITNSLEQSGQSSGAVTKEVVKQHMEALGSKEGGKEAGSPGTTVKTMTTDEITGHAKKFPTMEEFRKQDEQYRAEFEHFIEQNGVFNSAKVIEEVEDPHVADLLHGTLLKKINAHI